jgi:hypothetical protein
MGWWTSVVCEGQYPVLNYPWNGGVLSSVSDNISELGKVRTKKLNPWVGGVLLSVNDDIQG